MILEKFKRQKEEIDQRVVNLVKNAFFIKPDESVFIVYDYSKENIARLFAAACEEIGTHLSLCQIKEREKHTAEPPKPVAAAMHQSDFIIDITKDSLMYTEAAKTALKNGAKIVTMPGITEEMFSAFDIDYEELIFLCNKLEEYFTNGKKISVTTPAGSDFVFRCDRRTGLTNDGTVKRKGTLCNLPAGEAGVSVIENSAKGKMVIDTSMEFIGGIKKPIEVYLKNGKISEINGYEEAQKLKEFLEKEGEEARIFSGFSIGLNAKSAIIGNALNDGKALGTCKVAFGDNTKIGGKNKSSCHLDAVLKLPTVFVDNEKIVRDGIVKWRW